MKKLFFLLLFISVSFLSQAQLIDGFWGLKFGMNKEQVFAVLKDKVTEYQKIDNCFIFLNIEFGGHTFNSCVLKFNEDKLYFGLFSKKAPTISEAQTIFMDLKKPLIKKYGEIQKETKSFAKSMWVDKNKNFVVLDLNPVNDEISLMYAEGTTYTFRSKKERHKDF